MSSVQIPDEIMQQYELRARAAGFDTNAFIREALIEKLEDLEDVELAMERLAKARPSIPLKQVVKNLGLDD